MKDKGRVVFDYRTLLDKRTHKGKVLLRMKRGPLTYESWEGVKFYKDHPYQLVSTGEADRLLALPESGYVEFVVATVAQVEDYYVD